MSRRRRKRRFRRGSWARGALVAALAAGLGSCGATAACVALLRQARPPTSAFMLLARRADPASGHACPRVEQQWVDRERISPQLRLAVVVSEDQRFLLHAGFDGRQIREALRESGQTGRLRGASTISQQVAKNLFLWPGGGFARKAAEAWLTLWIEALWPKRRILEVYLNVAQFGPCVFGAEAAARRYFGRSAAELAPEQAALLAAVLPSPGRMRASEPGPYTLRRRDELLGLMRALAGAPHLRGL
jgi:monofunctional biosynthetic peptidoglycan transglycosylase